MTEGVSPVGQTVLKEIRAKRLILRPNHNENGQISVKSVGRESMLLLNRQQVTPLPEPTARSASG
jgi:hypothetical protein